MKYFYKSIKFTLAKWNVIKELADLLSAERGTKVPMSDASVEAAKRMIEERQAADTAGTPGRKAAAGSSGTQAQPKGVITD